MPKFSGDEETDDFGKTFLNPMHEGRLMGGDRSRSSSRSGTSSSSSSSEQVQTTGSYAKKGGKSRRHRKSKGKPTHRVGSHMRFTFDNKTMPGDKTLTKKPFLTGLKAHNLATNEPFNTNGAYLKSAANREQFDVGIKIDGLNGKSLNIYHDDEGQTYAYPLHAGSSVNYGHMNHGKGLFLGGDPLDPHGEINLKMSAEPLESFAKLTDDQQHVIVNLDFTAHAKTAPEGTPESLNSLGQIIVANGRTVLSKNKLVRAVVGDALDPTKSADKKMPLPFQTFKVSQEPFVDDPNRFQVMIDKPSYDQLLSLYKGKVATKAKTSANDYTVSLVRVNHKPGSKKPFGDLSNEPGLTQREIDIAHSRAGAVTVVMNHDIHHNGKPYDSSVETTAQSSSTGSKK